MKQIDMNKVPPEALAKMKAREAAKADPINNKELVLAFRAEGGGIMHIRPVKTYDGNGLTRGMTVAFKQKGGRIEFATSVQHRADDFTKKIGTKTAIAHFREGKTVTVPVRGAYPVQDLQRAMTLLT